MQKEAASRPTAKVSHYQNPARRGLD